MLRYIALGFIQGATEFLPVSSSGHLVIFQHLFGLSGPNTLLDSLLHLGTLFSVLIIFRKKITDLALAPFTGSRKDRKYLVNLILATIPIAVVGFLARDFVEAAFSSIRVAGIGLVITGTILWGVRYLKKSDRRIGSLTWKDSVSVGLAQIASLLPGISRSGVTISAGISKSLDPDFAAEFSFLLMVPAVLGANVLKVSEVITSASSAPFAQTGIGGYILGTLTSAVTGALAIKWLLNLIRKGRLSRFSYYCLPLGTIIILWSFLY